MAALTHASLHQCRLPYARPVRWSDITEEAAHFLVLRLQDDAGLAGAAEICLKPTWMGAGLQSLAAALQEVFLPLLPGLDLDDLPGVQQRLDGIPENHAAKALVDNALHDLQAARRGMPLWRQWQGMQQVPVSFTVTRDTPARMAAEAEAMVAQHGFRCLKIKGGQGPDVDVQALRALHSALGSAVDFYVDANGAYTREDALRYVQRMHAAGARVVEDPCLLVPDAAFTRLQQHSPCPVLVDFGCQSLRDTQLFLQAGARAFSLKPGRFGRGRTRAMQHAATAAGCQLVVGMFGESAVGTWQALAQASTLTGAGHLPAEVTWFLAMQAQVAHEVPDIIHGCITLPDIASVAETIDWDKLQPIATFTPTGP